ncbi:MAG: TIGR01777 family oxidoreductase, partial [Chthonomonadaceae bacterium]|nr:TIGR01777 family oxidoreductase [Chthonomonadaceae bacterium]
MKILVTGATGFIGRPLCNQLLQQGHQVIALTRNPEKARATLPEGITCLPWGTEQHTEWRHALATTHAILHLAGEPVASAPWTPQFKEIIRASRVHTTRQLVHAIKDASPPPTTLISASAVGFYGNRHDETLTEDSPPGTGFLAETCQQWEHEAQQATAYGLRVCCMRIGIVLGKGGALQKILYPLPLPLSPWKLGLGGPFGSGKQWMPWIHLHDAVHLFLWALNNPQAHGPINTTAPNPVTNAQFARALARALHRPALLPVPAFALRLLLGEFADTILAGQKALP